MAEGREAVDFVTVGALAAEVQLPGGAEAEGSAVGPSFVAAVAAVELALSQLLGGDSVVPEPGDMVLADERPFL